MIDEPMQPDNLRQETLNPNEETEYLVTHLIKYAENTEAAKKENRSIKLFKAAIIFQYALLALIYILFPSNIGTYLVTGTSSSIINLIFILKHLGIKSNNEAEAKEALEKILESNSPLVEKLKQILKFGNESKEDELSESINDEELNGNQR